MPFSFYVNRPKDLTSTFKKLKIRCEKYNGYLRGNEDSGEISSDGVVGTYKVESANIVITIVKKPLSIIPNFIVEKEIKKIFHEICS